MGWPWKKRRIWIRGTQVMPWVGFVGSGGMALVCGDVISELTANSVHTPAPGRSERPTFLKEIRSRAWKQNTLMT